MIRLFSRYWSLAALVTLGVETALLCLAVWLSAFLRFGSEVDAAYSGWSLLPRAAVFAGVVILTFYFNGLYDFEEHLSKRQLAIRMGRSFGIAAIVLWAIYYLLPSLLTGRGLFLMSALLGALSLAGWRLLLGWILRKRRFSERVLIVGADDDAVELAEEIMERKHLGYRILGFLSDDPALQGQSLINPRVIGTTSQVCSLALANNATRVVVAQRDYRGKLDMDTLLQCKTSGVRVERGSAYYEKLTGKIALDGLRKSWLIFSEGFVVSRASRLVKRCLDFFVASLILVLATPVMLIVALAIRIDSPGPVFFRQERVGRNGKIFTLLKFRSMRTGAERAGEAVWAKSNDPRVTRVGRFIRKTRIDELPQLVNVLRGDMSLVGPRPERESFVCELAKRSPFYEQRLVVRPGLTGWAQINAAYAGSFDESIEKLKYDLYYVKNLSFLLDTSILASTLRTVVLGNGAR